MFLHSSSSTPCNRHLNTTPCLLPSFPKSQNQTPRSQNVACLTIPGSHPHTPKSYSSRCLTRILASQMPTTASGLLYGECFEQSFQRCTLSRNPATRDPQPFANRKLPSAILQKQNMATGWHAKSDFDRKIFVFIRYSAICIYIHTQIYIYIYIYSRNLTDTMCIFCAGRGGV